MERRMTDEEIRRIVEPILRRHLGPYGFETAEVASGVDHDGDPAMVVSAKYRLGEPKLDADAALSATNDVWDAVRSRSPSRMVTREEAVAAVEFAERGIAALATVPADIRLDLAARLLFEPRP